MLEKISINDLNFYQTLANPIACAQILFSDFDNLSSFSENEFGNIRNYQDLMIGFDTLFCEDKIKSKKQNFIIKKGLSEIYNLGGRLTGKTIISIIIDSLISTFHNTYKWGAICSLDALHLRGVFEKIINALENHPILRMLKTHILRSPSYKLNTKNGCLLESINLNIASKNPGAQFFGKHVSKLWQEESSFMTKEVSNKQLMAQSEMGCINRWSGMTTFSKMSPMGEIFYNIKNRSKIVNFPSYVNPTWDEEKEEAAIREFYGKNSHGFLVQILGKVIEGGNCVFDMDRIRDTYKYDRKNNPITIKNFEINKNNYLKFREVIIVDKPINAEQTIIALDKGEGGAPTEVIVLFKIKGKFRYHYNITLFKLKPDEDEEVIDFIIEKLKPNLVGIDYTSGTGKTLFIHLSKQYPENIVGVSFNEKIDITFEKDDKGNIKYDSKSKPIFKQETVVDWSIQCLKDLFYNNKIECLVDFKLDKQIDGVIVSTSKQGKVIYGYKTENHLFQAFQVFVITNFITEFKSIQPIQKTKPGLGAYA